MGKLVVFWSPLHGQACVTASMSAVALALGEKYPEETILLTHTQRGMADLEGMLNMRMAKEYSQKVYNASGLTALILNAKQREVDASVVHGCAHAVRGVKNVFLMPGMEQDASLFDERETEELIKVLVSEKLPMAYDWVFVDIASGGNALSGALMERADIVVITLSQNTAVWELAFTKMVEFPEDKKVFFLFGGYHSGSKYSVRNFCLSYRGASVKRNVGIVPRCTGYMDAVSGGSVAWYYHINKEADKRDSSYEFMSELRETAEKLSRFAREGDR